MEVRNSLSFAVTEISQVGEARRGTSALATAQGMNAEAAGRVALVTTELAGNLVKHTPLGGKLLARALSVPDLAGVEILALDKGQGMDDVSRCLRDGYSTAGSPGTGLGAVSRTSDLFQIHSAPGVGTAILSRVWARPAPGETLPGLSLGVVNESLAGQVVCGDGWMLHEQDGRAVVMVADGLGHGPGAADASREAVRVARENAHRPPIEILDLMHPALHSTRGAAIAIAEIDSHRNTLRYAGVGNIAGVVATGTDTRSLASYTGIVGHAMQSAKEFSYPWAPGSTLIMHSDGVSTRWKLSAYPGLASRHPSLIAGVLYRDFGRATDDATVLVIRTPSPASATR